MGMVIAGIEEAQGSEGLIVSKHPYTVRLVSARTSEIDAGEDNAIDDSEPVADFVTITHEIIEADEEAFAYDRDTQEPVDEPIELEGKLIEQSIYVMRENHKKYATAGRYGKNELKDVILGYRVPISDDEIEWDQAAERGATANVHVEPSFREVNGEMRVANKFRRWKSVS